jgi:hypothetical protein
MAKLIVNLNEFGIAGFAGFGQFVGNDRFVGHRRRG